MTATRSSLLAKPRAPEPTPPAAATSRYRARLSKLVRGSIGRAYGPLLAAIPLLVGSMGAQRGDSVRHDASPVDEAARLVEQASGSFGTDFVKEAHAAATAAGGNVKAHTKTKLRAQLAAAPDQRVAAIKPYDSPKLAPLIDGFVAENVALIKGISPKLAADVQALVVQGLTSGVPAARLAQQIRERLDIASNRAETIAIDQIGKLDSQLSAQRTQDIGVTHFFWRTSNDERVRGNPDGKYPKAMPSHWDREGKRYSYAEPPRGKSGEVELPGTPIRCRCWQEPDFSTIAVGEAQGQEAAAGEARAPATMGMESIEEMEAAAARAMAEVEEMLARQQREIEEVQAAAAEEAAARERERLEDPRLEREAQGLEVTLAAADPAALEAALRRHKLRSHVRADRLVVDCENPIRGEGGRFEGCAPGDGDETAPTKRERQAARVERAAAARSAATRRARMMHPDQWNGELREAEGEVEEADDEIESATEDLNDATDDDERREATARIIAATDARALARARASAFRDMIEENRYPDDTDDDDDTDEESPPRVYPPLPADVVEKHAQALSAVDRERERGMAANAHERVDIPGKWAGRRVGGDSIPQGVSVEELSHAFAPPDGFSAVVDDVSGSKLSMQIRDAAGNKVGAIVREFRPGGEIHHSLFVLEEGARGSGMADVINGQSLLRYEKMGVKKVTVDAAWVGRYKWATMGFRFDEKESDVGYDRAEVEKQIERFLGANVASEETREQVRRLVDEPWKLARLTDGNEYEVSFKSGPKDEDRSSGRFHLGKALLLQEDMPIWTGVIDLDRNNEGYLHALSKLKVEARK